MDSYLVFDFETTGLSPRYDRIIQVGICRVVDGEIVENTGWLVNQPVSVPAQVVAIHGITTDRIREHGIDPKDSMARLLDAIGSAPACIGHNIHRFDIPFMETEATRLGFTTPKCHDFVDTAALFKGWRMGITRQPQQTHQSYARQVLYRPIAGLKYSISTCIEHLGLRVDTSTLHDACRDTYATHLIFQKLKHLC